MLRLDDRPPLARAALPRRALRRVTFAASSALVALVLASCGTPDDEADADATATSAAPSPSATATATTEPVATPEPSATTAPSPSATPSPTAASTSGASTPSARAKNPVGRWRNRELQWVLRIKASGRFVDDFAGVKNVRSGKWRLRGTRTIVLVGGDGVTTRGKLAGDTITIRGTVLKRVR
ncbi:hypothetical protein [Mumia sp. Pv 4-285]|uniref:hypothetical protein n=1 Tax=Mumia qirimensis TaxID=3234852 RepID=UPI00351D22E0